MAVGMASQFSEDGKYFGQISADGKLKIWNTLSNTFEQEFTPDFHLTSPCTCLHFTQNDYLKYKGGSPKKKKRKDSESSLNPNIVLGTTSGVLLLYSITNASLETTINSETNQSVNCLTTVDHNIIYSGADQNVLVWNLEKKKTVSKWKTGNENITAIQAIPESNQLLTAAKHIKLWDIEAKEILRTFVGHKSDVVFLNYICPQNSGDSYFLSGSKGDRILSCWSLNSTASEKNAVASFLMEDVVHNISITTSTDGTTHLAATVRSGVVHVYKHTLNGKSGKPLKPKTTIQVVSESTDNKDVVRPIRIVGAIYRDDDTLCIGHGSDVLLTFENVEPNSFRKLECLVRQDPLSIKASKQISISKTITPVINENVQYLTPATSKVSASKRKNDGTIEVPMEKRLENLTLSKDENNKFSSVDSVAQLLIQALHSKDKKILKTVLFQKNEEVIKNSVKRLPVTAFLPLVQELTGLIQGKTNSSQVASVWLKYIIQTHAGVLISNPDLAELFGSALGSIENRLMLLTPLNRLKGRLDLLLPQVNISTSKQPLTENEKPLLVYNDRDSIDSDDGGDELIVHSDSGSEWEEESDGDQLEENHVVNNSDVLEIEENGSASGSEVEEEEED